MNETLKLNYSSPKSHEDSPITSDDENEEEGEVPEEKKVQKQEDQNGAYLFPIPGPSAEIFYSESDMVRSFKKFYESEEA